MLRRFFRNNKEYDNSGCDHFFSLKRKSWVSLLGYLALIFCGSASAILSGKTSAIHGHPPNVKGTLYLLQPDGVTLIEKDELLHPSDIPNKLKLSSLNTGLEFFDKDGDLGLRAKIYVNEADIIWMYEDGKRLNSYEQSKPLGKTKKYRVNVVVPVEVSSATGIPSKDKISFEWQYKPEVGIVPKISNIKTVRPYVLSDGKDSHVITITVTDQRNQPVANQDVLISVNNGVKIADTYGEDSIMLSTNRKGKISVNITSDISGFHTAFFEIIENKWQSQIQMNFIQP